MVGTLRMTNSIRAFIDKAQWGKWPSPWFALWPTSVALPCRFNRCEGYIPCSARRFTCVGGRLGSGRLRLIHLYHNDHADELGDRPRPHLLLDTGTGGFDGLFGRPQDRGNFLVQQSAGYQPHDFPLPLGQRGEALVQLGVLVLAVSRTRVLRQCCGDGRLQNGRIDRLLEEIDGPRLHGLDTQGDRPMAREEDDRRGIRDGSPGLLHQQAVFPRKTHLQEEAGRTVWLLVPQKLAGGREGLDLYPERADEPS